MPSLLYASFDDVPAPKGASTHILAFARELGERLGRVLLVTPGAEELPPRPLGPGLTHQVVACPDDNVIGRARTFQARLARIAAAETWDFLHFRSPMEGLVLIDPQVRRAARIVYEVNGFPSIELKYHHRSLLDDDPLIDKLRRQEALCLEAADRIVTVSDVNRREIVARGIAESKVEVIRNGADLDLFPYRAPRELAAGEPLRVVYIGTLAVWQGVETLLEAVALAARERPVRLTTCGSAGRGRLKELEERAERLGVWEQVEFLPGEPQSGVAARLHSADVAAVPLLAVDRNVRQGCCPLKLLEALAAGPAVLASDLPVVRELATPDVHYLPARPGDARNWKNGLLRLADDGPLRRRLSAAGRAHVADQFTWRRSLDRLIELYRELGATLAPAIRPESEAAAEEA